MSLDNTSNNTIGGTAPADRNIISGGEGFSGIFITATVSNSNSNVVQGNYIGTNAADTAALPNNSGVVVGVNSANNVIGGTAAGAGNLISRTIPKASSSVPLPAPPMSSRAT